MHGRLAARRRARYARAARARTRRARCPRARPQGVRAHYTCAPRTSIHVGGARTIRLENRRAWRGPPHEDQGRRGGHAGGRVGPARRDARTHTERAPGDGLDGRGTRGTHVRTGTSCVRSIG
eukprot:3417261-Pleurochrysis_carterae.AAC.1